MAIRRREFLAVGAATVTALSTAPWASAYEGVDMYGLIGKMTAAPAKRDELLAVLLESTGEMPG
jgi:hypothetical protein